MPDVQSPNVSFERERGVYALHVTRGVAHAVVSVTDDPLRTSRILLVFRVLAEAGVPIFLIKLHRTAVTLAFTNADRAKAEQALKEAGMAANIRSDLALLAVRAASMRDLSGVMADIADALYDAGARLYETGDSHNSVLCLIDAGRVNESIQALCKTFELDPQQIRESSIYGEAGA